MKLKRFLIAFSIMVILSSFLGYIGFVDATPTKYEAFETGTGSNANVGSVSHTWYSETFTVGSTGHTVTSVFLQMQKGSAGSTGTLWVYIWNVNASSYPDPTTNLTKGSASIAGWSSSSYSMHEITLTEYTLLANTQYAIVANLSIGAAGSWVQWYLNGTNAYSGGIAYTCTDGVSWTTVSSGNGDLWFEVWGNSLADTISPTYSTPTTNTTIAGAVCNFTVTLADETALSNYTFGSNNTGTWANESWTTISGLSYKTNSTYTLNDTIGNVVQWEYWFSDSSNNTANTGVQTLTITSSGWSKTFDGVPSTQISTIDGVPLSKIGSVDGVP